MNRRVATSIVVGGLLVAVLGVTACGSGSSGASSGSTSTTEDTTLTVYNTPTAVNRIDTPPKGASVGDEGIYTGDLLASPGGATVGHSTDICTTMSKAGFAGLVHCDSSVTLKKGTLFVAANFSDDNSQTFAITGGTSAYDESRGQVTVTQGSGDESIVKVDID